MFLYFLSHDDLQIILNLKPEQELNRDLKIATDLWSFWTFGLVKRTFVDFVQEVYEEYYSHSHEGASPSGGPTAARHFLPVRLSGRDVENSQTSSDPILQKIHRLLI